MGNDRKHDVTTHPHRIDPLVFDERRTSRNCLRIDSLVDGIAPRCNLRPHDEAGAWVLDHRPYHLREMILLFDYCIHRLGCHACRVAQQAYAEINAPFCRVPIHVVKQHSSMVVLTLGRCAWYDLYTGADINAVAAWVKAHGGALGGFHEDQLHGRYRVGIVNGYQLPHEVWPPHVEIAAQRLQDTSSP